MLEWAQGKVRWRQTLADVLFVQADQTQAYVGQAREISALDLRTGKTRWTSTGTGRLTVGTDRLYLSGAQSLTAIEPSTGKTLWKTALTASCSTDSCVHEFQGRLYLASDESELLAVDVQSGDVVSRVAWGSANQSRSGIAFAANEFYFSDAQSSTIRRLDILTQRELAPLATTDSARALSVQSGHLLALGDRGLTAYDLKEQAQVWHVRTGLFVGNAWSPRFSWVGDVLHHGGGALLLRAGRLSMQVAAGPEPIAVGEAQRVRVTFTNRSPCALKLATWELSWHLRASAEWIDLGGSRRQVSVANIGPQAPPVVSDFVELKPGGTWSFSVEVPTRSPQEGPLFASGNVFELPPGHYKLRLRYENVGTDAYAGAPGAMTPHPVPAVWTGQLVSEALQVKIESARPEQDSSPRR